MLECALYSYVSSLKQIQVLRKAYKEDCRDYNELVYSRGDTLIIINTNEKITTVTKKKQIDKNRNRKYVCHIIEQSEVDSFDDLIKLLELAGYTCINKTKIQEIFFTTKDFYISVSKEIENLKIEENNVEKYWLVKVYSLSDSLQNAEQVFNSNVSKIEDILDLRKIDTITFFE